MLQTMLMLSAIVAMVVAFALSEKGSPMLKTCAKQHNVYDCELVAVPKSK